MNQDDFATLHALSVAALGRPWGEVSIFASEIVVNAKLVDFGAIGAPFLTDDGVAVFREAIAAMKEKL